MRCLNQSSQPQGVKSLLILRQFLLNSLEPPYSIYQHRLLANFCCRRLIHQQITSLHNYMIDFYTVRRATVLLAWASFETTVAS